MSSCLRNDVNREFLDEELDLASARSWDLIYKFKCYGEPFSENVLESLRDFSRVLFGVQIGFDETDNDLSSSVLVQLSFSDVIGGFAEEVMHFDEGDDSLSLREQKIIESTLDVFDQLHVPAAGTFLCCERGHVACPKADKGENGGVKSRGDDLPDFALPLNGIPLLINQFNDAILREQVVEVAVRTR